MPRIEDFQLEAWLPAGNSILTQRANAKGQHAQGRLEAWSRDFVLARLRQDGARDCSSIAHPQGFQMLSRTRDGNRLWIQSTKPEA